MYLLCRSSFPRQPWRSMALAKNVFLFIETVSIQWPAPKLRGPGKLHIPGKGIEKQHKLHKSPSEESKCFRVFYTAAWMIIKSTWALLVETLQ